MASVVTPTVSAGFVLAAPTPALLSVFSGLGGLLGNGNYSYKVTYVSAFGETLPSSASITGNPGSATGSAALTAIPTGNAYVINRKIYRTAVGGSSYLLLTTLSDNVTTTYNDIIADGSLGAAAPTVSTASPTQVVNTVPTYTGNLLFQPGGAGNTITIAPVTPASSRTYTLPDAGNAANIMLTSMKGATANVTQITSLATACTTTATTGIVTLFSAIGGGASAAFTLNNLNILSTSNVVVWSNMVSGTAFVPVSVVVSAIAAGSCTVTATNNDGTHATLSAPLLYYLII